MKKFMKMLASFAALATIFAFSSCSNDDDSDYDDNLKLVILYQATNKAKAQEADTDKTQDEDTGSAKYSLTLTKKADSFYNNTYYNSVWTTTVNGSELALCLGSSWKLVALVEVTGAANYEFTYASGEYADSTSDLNSDGTVYLDVTNYNSEAFDSEITKGTAVISGTQCTLTLK